MRVRLLGGFDVEGVAERDLGSRKARTLLKLLVVRRGAPVSVDAIADVLWDDDQPAKPAEQIGVLVSRLRGALGSDRIVRSDAGYSVNVDWVDVDEVDALTSAAAGAMAEGRVGAARAAASAAIDLARGPLLGDDDAPWAAAPRAAAEAVATRARRIAIDTAEAAGDLDGVVATAERVLTVDPYDEAALRALMRAHLAARRPASALAVYGRQRARLADDLGVPPTVDTEALYALALQAADGSGDDRPPPASRRGSAPGNEAASPPIGRAEPWGALDGHFGRVRTGACELVVVSGDPGIGKTTLVDAWLGALDDDVLVLRGRCDELGRDLPLQPVADALADHLRMIGPDAASAVLGADTDALAPLLGPLAGTTASGITEVSDPEQGRARVFTALLAVVVRAASGRPTVLLVEDLHLAASSTVGWLAFAQRRATGVLLLTTVRPPAPAGLEHAADIALGPLSLDDVATIAGAEHATDAFERTGGHPLLLAALTSTTDAGTAPAPTTLRAAVGTQLAAIDDAAARTVRVAAVVGLECDADLIATLRGIPIVDAVMHLEVAVATGLIVERGSGFAFRHDMLRDAVNATSSAAQVAALQRDTAAALARRPDADPLAIAVHAREGGASELAAQGFLAAAGAAAARFDLDTAERHLAAAIEAMPRSSDAFVVRARLRMSRSAFVEAERDAATAIAHGGGASAFEVAGWVAYYRRHYEPALAFAEEAIARSAPDSPLRVSAAALAGRVRHGTGDLRGAIAHLDAPGESPLSVRGVADVWLAQARLHQGRPTEALAALARPLVAPDSLVHPWAPLHLRFNRALALGQLGRVAESLAVAEELRLVTGREGAVGERFVAPAANVASWVLRWSGRPEEADERNQLAIAATGGDAGPSAESFAEGHYVALLDLADGRMLAGDLDGAAPLVQRLAVLDGWTGTMAWHQRHRLHLLRSRLALADGDHDRAAELAAGVAGDAAARGASRYELLALALVGLADPSVAAARLEPVVDGLGRCALLDGWVLVAQLAAARKVDAWRAEAERRATAMVDAAGDHREEARRFVDRMLRS